jgi:hypothetical protein
MRDLKMMKSIPLLLIAVFLAGCDLLSPGSSADSAPNPSFTLTDTLGRSTSQFHTGEDFYMYFSLRNTTGDTLTYYHTGPSIIFSILKGDSLVATSVDGMAFPQVVIGDVVPPGDTLRARWRAPSSPARVEKLILAPGSYEAEVSFPWFAEAKFRALPPITFSVVE